jgi:fructose transport system substrate-binding protein
MIVRPGTARMRVALTSLALAPALLLAACGGSSGGSGSTSGSGSSSGTAASSGTGSSGGAAAGTKSGKKVGVTLIVKTLTNPYFVSMINDAKKAATQNNVNLSVAGGTADGDTASQINAIQNAISRGDKGILITINGDAVNAALRQAKQNNIKVIALDTALNPANLADVTYATDNEQAGKLAGQYAAAKVKGKKAVIAMLDLFNNQVVSVDIQRDHGFLEGMGINPGSKTLNGKEAKTGNYSGGAYEVACHQPTQGAVNGGRQAMENCLSANPDINVVYTINEPSAQGAYNALKAAGKQNQAGIFTIDGSCNGVKLVDEGVWASDSLQYPGKMASLGVEAIAKLASGGSLPSAAAGQTFINTGTDLVAKQALPGVTSLTTADAKTKCWG